MWKCPECETLNEGESCVICNWKRPTQDEIINSRKTNMDTGLRTTMGAAQKAEGVSVSATPVYHTAQTAPDPYAVVSKPAGTVSPVTPVMGAHPEPPRKTAVSRKEFFNTYLSPGLKSGLKKNLILTYICLGVTLTMDFAALGLMQESVFALFVADMLEIALLALLAILITTTKSKICAIGMIALSGAEMIMGVITMQEPSGWIIMAASVSLLVLISKADKQYKEFLKAQGMVNTYRTNVFAVIGICVAAVLVVIASYAIAGFI